MLVLLIVVDSLRHDALSCCGGPAQTPRIDQLAAEGTRFERCYSSASWTVPSLSAIATGTFPHKVGVSRWRHAFPARRPTLMSAFAAAGFDVRLLAHNPRWCLANTGFRGTVGDSQDPGAVLAALRPPAGSDRLVILHHWWTHLPYRQEAIPRPAWRRLCADAIDLIARDPGDQAPRARDRYHEAIEAFDAELLSRYLDAAQGGGRELLVALSGDHGENWGESLPAGRKLEHIYDLHGRWMTDDTTHVPLILWGRGVEGAIPAGARLGGLARGVDLAPTLAALAGVPWPGPLQPAEGSTYVDRGIAADGAGLDLDGRSLHGEVMDSLSAPGTEALTVSSFNAVVPARYPPEATRLWRRFGLRTEHERLQWDALDAGAGRWVEREGRLRRLGRWSHQSPPARAWSRLRAERERAVGPAVTLKKGVFPSAGGGAKVGPDDADLEEPSGEEEAVLNERLRMLGYLD